MLSDFDAFKAKGSGYRAGNKSHTNPVYQLGWRHGFHKIYSVTNNTVATSSITPL